MHTPEEIKKALRCLRSIGWKHCSDCPYHGKGLPPCVEAVTKDAEEYIDLHESDKYKSRIKIIYCKDCELRNSICCPFHKNKTPDDGFCHFGTKPSSETTLD